MALSIYKEEMDNSYQLIFNKVTVAKEIANYRAQKMLTYGQTLKRARMDFSNVFVRPTVIGSDSTIDVLDDASELLTINQNPEVVVQISEQEMSLANNLTPSEFAGKQLAIRVGVRFDADVLVETRNAFATFDNGDLTGSASDGTAITLNATTVPQLVAQTPAKLLANNQVLTDLVMVVDPYHASAMQQYVMGKNIDLAGFMFKNGFAGPVGSAKLYVSNNLAGEAVLTYTGQPSNGETFVIGGVTFTAVTTIGSTAGNFLIGADQDATYANLTALINNPTTTSATQVALSTANANRIRFTLRLAATQNATANTVTILGTGSGRLSLTDGLSNLTITKNFVHAYFGQRGAIDVAMRDDVNSEIRDESRRRASNIFASALYGVRTFNDGAQQFLDVQIAA
jgi:hypothetical protein